MSSDDATGAGQPGIGRAYVSADSGIAEPVEGVTTAPDQIYVEFSEPVIVDGADGRAVPADGFSLDGTLAGIETVERGTVAGDPDGTGSRVLVLTLSTGITAAEQPTLVEADLTESEPDHIVCTFDEAVEEDASALTIDGAETRVVGTVDTGGPRELTLELIDPVPEGETVKLVSAPSA